MLPADEDIARRVLAELTAWMGSVYLRYPDAAASLPECWLWHPDLVEELLWLSHAWTAAYQGPDASVAMTQARTPAEDRCEDSIHHAQQTLTQITQQRAADQHHTATQARAEQLARWHTHDQETQAAAAHPAEPDRMEPQP